MAHGEDNPPVPVDSPHKGASNAGVFPYYGVFMLLVTNLVCPTFISC